MSLFAKPVPLSVLVTALLMLLAVACGGDGQADLREGAGAYALAQTEARYEDVYAATTPAFQEECSLRDWIAGNAVTRNFLRFFNGLDDDALLEWNVTFVEERGDTGSVLLRVSNQGVPLNDEFRADPWRKVDGEWRFDAPPELICI